MTGAALAALGSDGLFSFSAPLPPHPDQLSRDSALHLARAVVRHVTVSVGGAREYIEQVEHGAPIDWDGLTPCDRRIIPRYSNFLDPGPSIPYYVRTTLGPAYLIEFCEPGGRRAVKVEIFVHALARVADDGSIIFPVPNGNNFLVRGIPLQPLADVTPEYGARLVHSETGVRIREVPELDGCLFVISPCWDHLGWHWKYVLETPVQARLSTGEVVSTAELFTQAGFGSLDTGRLYIAAPDQPAPAWHAFTIVEEQARSDSVLVHTIRSIRLVPISVVK